MMRRKGFRKTHLGVLMLVHRIAPAPLHDVFHSLTAAKIRNKEKKAKEKVSKDNLRVRPKKR